MRHRPSRREFLQTSGLAAAGLWVTPWGSFRGSPNEDFRVGVVGVANRGSANLGGVSGVPGVKIAALCDVDANYLADASKRFPEATTYKDLRRLLDQEKLDGLVVSTPDHTHAVAALGGLRRGWHVYCEKPLAHSVSETRALIDAAAKHGCVTQMGTQIHAEPNYRRVVEAIQGGMIGAVGEVHVFCNKAWGGGQRVKEAQPVPAHLDWDLWMGPAPEHKYAAGLYHPANWRRFWDYGGGTLADMACHYMDLPFWALKLKDPVRVEAEGPRVHPDTAPLWMEVRYEFPARGDLPPVKFTWYDGSRKPKVLEEHGLSDWGSGVLFVGERGLLISDYGRHVLLPEADFRDAARPARSIPDSIGHHREWVEASRTGGETTCSFDYSGPMTEAVLLGIVAYRTGEVVQWDAKNLTARGLTQAEPLIRPAFREGWSL